MSQWSLIKLELDRSAKYPLGSVSRAYFIRAPLDETGLIDSVRLSREPHSAAVRRFWPSQHDLSGYIVKSASGWHFCDADRGFPDEWFASIPDASITAGSVLEITERDGTVSTFRVAEITPF